MTRGFQGTDHVWLVMMKAMRALTRYAAADIEETGLGLVSRVESAEDRRVRIVALTRCGNDLIASAFRKHSRQMKRVFSN